MQPHELRRDLKTRLRNFEVIQMPQFVDASGVAVFIEPPIVITPAVKKRFQDGMILRLMRIGLSMVDVAKVLNMSEALVRRRLDTMPEGAAKYYANSNALDWLA
jgi:hypothetical protein